MRCTRCFMGNKTSIYSWTQQYKLLCKISEYEPSYSPFIILPEFDCMLDFLIILAWLEIKHDTKEALSIKKNTSPIEIIVSLMMSSSRHIFVIWIQFHENWSHVQFIDCYVFWTTLLCYFSRCEGKRTCWIQCKRIVKFIEKMDFSKDEIRTPP